MFIRSYFGCIAAAANPEVDGYAAVVSGISDLVAYWRLGDTSAATLADGSGNGHDGTYPNAPTAFGAPPLTWQASDGKAVNFGGAGYGQVAHNAAFATPRGMLCGYFMANNLTAARTFVNKGTGFVLQVLANGTLQLTIGATTIATLAGVITAGVEYHLAVLWDEVAVFLCLDGRVVVWTRAHTTGLTGNNSPWQFGRTMGGANSNVRADELAFYSRRVSWTELDDLSEFIRGLPYDPTPETSQVVNSAAALQTAGDRRQPAGASHSGRQRRLQ
jgi:Concanavalin A-like lectin/glucanases superfamily